MQMAQNFNVTLDLKDISDSEAAMAELTELSGKTQTPFFIDTATGISMAESSDIIDYLRQQSKGAAPAAQAARPRVHVGGSVCESCEG